MSSQWHFSRGTERYGPFGWDEMLKFAREGRIMPEDQVINEAGGEWQRADHIPGLLPTSDSGYKRDEKSVQSKTFIIIGASLIAVILIVGIALLAIKLISRNILDSSAKNPDEVVIAFWDAYKRMDLLEANQYVSGDLFGDCNEEGTIFNDNPYAARLHDLIYGNLELTVDGHTIDEDKAVVNIKLSSPDLETLLEEDEDLSRALFGLYSMAMLSPDDLGAGEIAEIEEFLKDFEAAILQAPKITEENTVILRLEDGQWKITDMFGSDSL